MRTTITLDDDLLVRIKDLAHRSGMSFKDLLNAIIRRGLAAQQSADELDRFVVEPHAGGFLPGVDVARLNQLIDELEVDEFINETNPRR